MATHRGPRLNQRVLTVFLLVGLPVLAIGVGLVLRAGQHRLSDSYAQHLEQVAQQTSAAVDAYVYRRVLDVSLLARTPELRAAAAAVSARPFTNDEATRRAHDAPAVPLASSNPAVGLSRRRCRPRSHLPAAAADRSLRSDGRRASGGRPCSTWAMRTGGAPPPKTAGVRASASPMCNGILLNRAFISEMTAPVFSPGSDGFAGLLNVAVDSREMLALVGGVGLGQTGEAVLLRDNGSIVFSRSSSDPNAPYFARDRIRDLAATLRSPDTVNGAHLRITGDDGNARLVGVPAASSRRAIRTSHGWLPCPRPRRNCWRRSVRLAGTCSRSSRSPRSSSWPSRFISRCAWHRRKTKWHRCISCSMPHVAHVGDVDSDEEDKPPPATVA